MSFLETESLLFCSESCSSRAMFEEAFSVDFLRIEPCYLSVKRLFCSLRVLCFLQRDLCESWSSLCSVISVITVCRFFGLIVGLCSLFGVLGLDEVTDFKLSLFQIFKVTLFFRTEGELLFLVLL